MLHKELLGLSVLFFFVWVFIANPSEKDARLCSPVSWVGNVAVSVTALVAPTSQPSVKGIFDKTEFGCRYVVWRLFYQDRWNAYISSQETAKRSAEEAALSGAKIPPTAGTTPQVPEAPRPAESAEKK